jgi:hypothetical protein
MTAAIKNGVSTGANHHSNADNKLPISNHAA